MNRSLLLILLLLSAFSLFSDSYNEGLKYDALGDNVKALEYFHDYFKRNINDVNQDNIIEKLIYCSTLLPGIDESLKFLVYYVKYMENENSRFRIYKKIAEIYELSGQIYEAGIYYEKAAYTVKDYIDYSSLIDSLEMLVELGVYIPVKYKLIEILTELDDIELKDSCYLLLSRVYKLNGEDDKIENTLDNISKKSGQSELYRYENGIMNELGKLDSNNFEKIITYSPEFRLKTPSDYIGKKSLIKEIPELSSSVDDDSEIYIGQYSSREEAAGIINIVNQMNLPWFFDKNNDGVKLYIFSEDRDETVDKLRKLGIITR